MTRPIVLVDCDGVLSDFIGAILDFIFHRTGERFVHDDVTTWGIFDGAAFANRLFGHHGVKRAAFDHVKSPGQCMALEPLPGALDGLRALGEVADVHIVTSPMDSLTWHGEREAWLEKHAGIRSADVTHTHRKHGVHGDLFVDDRPEHVAAWREKHPNGRAFLWAAPHNRNETEPRMSCWQTLIGEVRKWNR